VSLNGLDALTPELLVLLIPLVVLQFGLLVLAVIDLLRDDRRVRGGNKGLWAVVIVFVSMIGPILYFLLGREEGVPEPQAPAPGAMPGWGSPHDPPFVRTPDGAPIPDGIRAPADAMTAPAAGTAMAVAPVAPAVAPVAPAVVPAATAEPRSDRSSRARPAPDAPPAITVEGLTKRYRGGVLALDRLTMAVPEGSVFGLLGPNGAGKTTCLRLLAGLTRATAGAATVSGIPVAGDVLGVRRKLGYLEQDPRAYGWMTGREQLRMLGRLHGLDGAPLERAIGDALARVDLEDAADRRAGTYSGGMRQRLGIAGALVHRPPVVILDEPVSALDPEGRRDVLNLIVDLRGETTVLFSTHVLADVERICDRVGILAHGRLVVEGRLAELLDRYALPVYRIEAEPGQASAVDALAARLNAMPWVTGLGLEHGLLTIAVSDPELAARELLPAITAEQVSVISVARARPTLEDVFLRLTAETAEAAA
jgi:ABC-2 type transport system ATP-binding protein